MSTFKLLCSYWSFYYYCLQYGPWPKADLIYNNKIKPLAQKHPILNFVASLYS